jgi:hypothetical protein
MSKDQGLIVEVKDEKLVISIGKNILGFACTVGNPSWPENFKITDIDEFIKEVKNELEREEEDGTTLIHRMLDKAACEVLEQGGLGVEETEDDLNE